MDVLVVGSILTVTGGGDRDGINHDLCVRGVWTLVMELRRHQLNNNSLAMT